MRNKEIKSEQSLHIEEFFYAIKRKSDLVTNYFLWSYFVLGLLLAFYYDTWQIAFGVGSVLVLAYYSAKITLPKSDFYQYVLSAVFGLFMAQYIFQMHGMFEMHFLAFIGSAMLITYQNWKLQIPITFVVVFHHALFAYLQFTGYDEIYFTQLDYMSLQTFFIHILLAAVIFFICGLWAYQFKQISVKYIEQTFNLGKLKQEEIDKEKRSEELIIANKELAFQNKEKEKLATELSLAVENLKRNEELLEETGALAKVGGWEIYLSDMSMRWTDEVFRIHELEPGKIPSLEEALNYYTPQVRQIIQHALNNAITTGEGWELELPFITSKGKHLWVQSNGKTEMRNAKVVRLFGVFQDITGRKKAEEERIRIIDDLIIRNNDLEQFTYIVSHNLRAPLANIKGIAGVIQHERLDENEKNNLITDLSLSVNRLDEVIGDLNHILQVKHVISENKEPVRFSKLVSDIRTSINGELKKENIELITDFIAVDEILTIKAYLYSIFHSLISNSVKYRRQDVPVVIKIKSEKAGNKIIFTFTDNGLGIDLSKRGDQVFGLYKRFHPSIEGKGLGLYMVKTQVEKLGGKISINSEVNKGTQLTIELNS